MRYFELDCTAYIKQDIIFQKSFEILSKYISFSMISGGLENIHKKEGFKYYAYGGFLPIENEKKYKKGSTYHFCIRSLDEKFIDILLSALRKNINNKNLLVVETYKKKIEQFFISELYSATPVIVSIRENERFWTIQESGDIMQLKKQLHENLEKKYNTYFNEKLQVTQDFIQLLKVKNETA